MQSKQDCSPRNNITRREQGPASNNDDDDDTKYIEQDAGCWLGEGMLVCLLEDSANWGLGIEMVASGAAAVVAGGGEHQCC